MMSGKKSLGGRFTIQTEGIQRVRTLEEGRINRPERAANVVKERLIEEKSRTGDAVNSQNVIKIITRIQGE